MLRPAFQKYLTKLDNWPTDKHNDFPSDETNYIELLKSIGLKKDFSMLSCFPKSLNISLEEKHELFAFMYTNSLSLVFNDSEKYLFQTFQSQYKQYVLDDGKSDFVDYFSNHLKVIDYWEKRSQETTNPLLQFHYLDRILFLVDKKPIWETSSLEIHSHINNHYSRQFQFLPKENVVKISKISILLGLTILKKKNVKKQYLFIILKRILYLSKKTNFFKSQQIQTIAKELFDKKKNVEKKRYCALVKAHLYLCQTNKEKQEKKEALKAFFLQNPNLEQRYIESSKIKSWSDVVMNFYTEPTKINFSKLWIWDWLCFNKDTKVDSHSINKIQQDFSEKILCLQEKNKENYDFIQDSFLMLTKYYLFKKNAKNYLVCFWKQLEKLKHAFLFGKFVEESYLNKKTKKEVKNNFSKIQWVVKKFSRYRVFLKNVRSCFPKSKSKINFYSNEAENFEKECLVFLQQIKIKSTINNSDTRQKKQEIKKDVTQYIFDDWKIYKKFFSKIWIELFPPNKFSLNKKLFTISFFSFNSIFNSCLKPNNNLADKIMSHPGFKRWTIDLNHKTIILKFLMEYICKDLKTLLKIFKTKNFFVDKHDVFENFKHAMELYVKNKFSLFSLNIAKVLEESIRYFVIKNKIKISLFKNNSSGYTDLDHLKTTSLSVVVKELNKYFKNEKMINKIDPTKSIPASTVFANLKTLIIEKNIRNIAVHEFDNEELENSQIANWIFQCIYLLTFWELK